MVTNAYIRLMSGRTGNAIINIYDQLAIHVGAYLIDYSDPRLPARVLIVRVRIYNFEVYSGG